MLAAKYLENRGRYDRSEAGPMLTETRNLETGPNELKDELGRDKLGQLFEMLSLYK